MYTIVREYYNYTYNFHFDAISKQYAHYKNSYAGFLKIIHYFILFFK